MVFAGGWIPAPITYGPLISALGSEVHPVLTVMQAFLGDCLPDGYGMATEAAVIEAAADAAGADRFDLVGFSGGARAALAFVATRPERVRSLVLAEPAWIGMACGAPTLPSWRRSTRSSPFPTMRCFPPPRAPCWPRV